MPSAVAVIPRSLPPRLLEIAEAIVAELRRELLPVYGAARLEGLTGVELLELHELAGRRGGR